MKYCTTTVALLAAGVIVAATPTPIGPGSLMAPSPRRDAMPDDATPYQAIADLVAGVAGRVVGGVRPEEDVVDAILDRSKDSPADGVLSPKRDATSNDAAPDNPNDGATGGLLGLGESLIEVVCDALGARFR